MAKLSDDVLTYMQEHNVSVLLEHIVRKLTEDMPPKPLQYISDLLKEPIPPQIIISGPPSSGKGTQCEAIVENFGVVHISSGHLLRAEVRAGTDIGKMADSYIKKGELVPDKLVIDVIRRRLLEDDVQQHGWLLDGFPRTLKQAEALEADGVVPHIFVLLEVPDETVVERIALRRTDPATGHVYHLKYNPPPEDDVALCERLVQRSDDHHDIVLGRLEVYHENLGGIHNHYKSLIEVVNGDQPIKDVTRDVIDIVSKRRLV